MCSGGDKKRLTYLKEEVLGGETKTKALEGQVGVSVLGESLEKIVAERGRWRGVWMDGWRERRRERACARWVRKGDRRARVRIRSGEWKRHTLSLLSHRVRIGSGERERVPRETVRMLA